MNMTRRIGVAGLLAAAALNVWAAPASAPAAAKKFDVSGTWTAKTEGGFGGPTTTVFVLKQEGDKLSGTVSTNGAPPVEITEARVLRTSIYFEVTAAPPARPAAAPGAPGAPGAAPGAAGAAPGAGGPPAGGGGRGGGMGGPGGGMGGMGMGMGRGPMTFKYTGSLSGDELKLTSQMKIPARDGDAPSGGGAMKTEMVAKRQ